MTRRFSVLFLSCLSSLGSASGAHAAGAEAAVAAKPAPPPAAKLPSTKLPPARPVDDILKDIVAALGGAEELGKHRSMHTKMSIAFQGLGISGTAEHYGAVGDKALTSTAIPNVASTREGTDGTRSWSQDPINGLRLLTGVEAEQAHLEAVWNIELRFRELFPKIEARNDVAEDGTRVECLTLTPKLSPAMTDCYDARTHLLTSQRGVRSGPQGDTPFVARMKDWRPVGGTKVAFVTEMQVGPLSFIGTVTTAEMDVPIEASLFAVPEPGAATTKEKGARNKKAPAVKPTKESKETKDSPVRPE